jgi:all-trans-8'-apo-beta-carotenal 15,15'-oxygenase
MSNAVEPVRHVAVPLSKSVASVARAPALPGWRGGFEDLARDHAFEPLRVTGALPHDLDGSFYRNGGGRFGVAGERYRHWFDADGAVSGVRLEGGAAYGAARVVQTEGLAREAKAGKRLFGGYDTPFTRPFRELVLRDGKNPANTSVLVWQGRLFATCEAGKPFEMSTRDLASMGETDLGGAVTKAFSAHSHYIAARRCTYNFGLTVGPKTTVDVYALPDEGAARRIASFRIDGLRLNHDFVVTDRHIVFVLAPMYLSLFNMILGRKGAVSSAKWKPAEGTEIVVIPLDAPENITRWKTDAFFLEHSVNAYESGDELVFDYIHYASPRGLEGFVGKLASGQPEAPLESEVRRATLDVARKTLKTETLLARAVELPRVSPQVEARRHRFAYYAGWSARGVKAPFDAIVKHDTETGRVDVHAPGVDEYPSEAVFVPRAGSVAEDDGYVLSLVYDAAVDRSRLDVLDARGIGDGPIVSCHFDHAIPFGFHGAWAPRQGA